MSVKGRDEREWTLEANSDGDCFCHVAGSDPAGYRDRVVVVPKSRLDAALLEAEARERELEAERDEARAIKDYRLAADPVVDGPDWLPEHLRPRPGELEIYIEMCRALQGEEGRLRDRAAVLVEALAGAEEFIERVTMWTGGDPDEVHEILAAIRSAAGVVEAEPARDHRAKTAALAAGEPCPDCGMRHADPLDFLDDVEAEPDRRTDE